MIIKTHERDNKIYFLLSTNSTITYNNHQGFGVMDKEGLVVVEATAEG